MIDDPEAARKLTAYFGWSAWAASARRPAIYLLADLRMAPGGFPWRGGERSGPAPQPPAA